MKQKTLAIDFDGTIAEYDKWRGIYHIGNIKPDAVEIIKKLSEKYTLILFTNRLNPHINNEVKTTYVHLVNWLSNNNLLDKFILITSQKPIADIYIDDRGYKFENWKKVLEDLDSNGE